MRLLFKRGFYSREAYNSENTVLIKRENSHIRKYPILLQGFFPFSKHEFWVVLMHSTSACIDRAKIQNSAFYALFQDLEVFRNRANLILRPNSHSTQYEVLVHFYIIWLTFCWNDYKPTPCLMWIWFTWISLKKILYGSNSSSTTYYEIRVKWKHEIR